MTFLRKILAKLGFRCRYCGGKLQRVDPRTSVDGLYWDRVYCSECGERN